jgi:F0F1-type ATP synthase membrane subunit c/vacuolar-type H+-ATPase subunit K
VSIDPRDPRWSQDPGWGDAVRSAWMFIIPFGLQLRLRKLQREGADGLVVLRSVFLAFVAAIVLFAIVVAFLDPRVEGASAAGWVALGLAAYGVLVVFVLTPIVERPLSCDSDHALQGSYRTRFFLRVALAESVALLGFVLMFQVGASWVYYTGGAVTLVGLAWRAPTARNLMKDEDELRARGCARSLVTALRGVEPPPATR